MRAALLAALTLAAVLTLAALVHASCVVHPARRGFVPGVGSALDVAVDASSHADLASDPFGLATTSVSSPSSPTLLGTSATPFRGQHVAVGGTKAIVAGKDASGFQHFWILNVATPSAPVVVGELSTTITVGTGLGPGVQKIAMNSTGTVAVATLGFAGIYIIDLATPASPVLTIRATTGFAEGLTLSAAGTTAYYTDYSAGLVILNITTPSAPSQIGTFNIAQTWRDVGVSGNTAYTVLSGSGTVNVINITNPAAPSLTTSVGLTGFGSRIVVSGTQAIVRVATGSGTQDSLDILDLTVPTAPVRIASQLVGNSGSVAGMDLRSGVGYIASNAAGLKTYTISATPGLLGTLAQDFTPFSVCNLGTTVVELGERLSDVTIMLRTINAATPTAPVVQGTLTTALAFGTSIHPRIACAGTIAVFTAGNSGMRVVNLANPASPTIVGTFATSGFAEGITISADSTRTYLTDYTAGLVIVNTTTPSAPAQLGTFTIGGTYRDVLINGTTAYLIVSAGNLYAVNVTNPAAASFITSIALSGFGVKGTINGNTVLVKAAGSSVENMDVVSVTAPTAPVKTQSITVGASGSIQDLSVSGNTAFIASGLSGLLTYNLLSPVNHSTTPGLGSALAVVAGANTAYVADDQSTVDVYTY